MRVTLNLHLDNYNELRRQLMALEDTSLWSQDNDGRVRQTLREVVRTLHNFLASAKTLIDHTRVHMDQFHPEESIRKAYDQKIRDLNHDNLQSFVQCLRNYTLHRTAAQIGAQISATPFGPRSGAILRVDELLKWDGWTAPATRYIESAGAEIAVREAIDEYMKRIKALYEWLRELDSSVYCATLKRLSMEIELVPEISIEGA